ncbi:peptidase C39 family protein [Methanoculleus sp. UBA291]|mgnify:FL=1|uniref:peptidase C39 family protein n=1 Tax=Methanoculleus sp. UBA291 TaxID=1915495 RepID=UPI00316ACA5D
MRAERGASIDLDIPFYRQHYDFTCGPAALMMALKYLDDSVRTGTDLEIDIWREANLIAVRGTSRYGLAFSAAVRGFSAGVASNTGRIDFVEKVVPPLSDPKMQLLREQFFERRIRCRRLGVRERRQAITGRTIRTSLSLNRVPLIVINSLVCSNEDLPHWVVVTGIDDAFLYYNNPLDAVHRKRKTRISTLKEFIGYHGDQSMVEVWRE